MTLPRLFCSLFVICAVPALIQAQNGIQIISQNYNISASWGVIWALGDYGDTTPYPLGDWSAGYSSYPMTGGYNLSSTDGSPLAASTAAITPGPATQPYYNATSPLTASASIDLFSLQNHAQGYPYGSYQIQGSAGAGYFLNGSIQTSVQASWLFSPDFNSLDASIITSGSDAFGPDFANMIVTMTDLTDSTTLLNIVPSDPNNQFSFASSGDYQMTVDPSHVYELSISGWSDTFDGDDISENISASLTSVPEPVPEPGSCWLFSFGLAGLWGFKSRFKSV